MKLLKMFRFVNQNIFNSLLLLKNICQSTQYLQEIGNTIFRDKSISLIYDIPTICYLNKLSFSMNEMYTEESRNLVEDILREANRIKIKNLNFSRTPFIRELTICDISNSSYAILFDQIKNLKFLEKLTLSLHIQGFSDDLKIPDVDEFTLTTLSYGFGKITISNPKIKHLTLILQESKVDVAIDLDEMKSLLSLKCNFGRYYVRKGKGIRFIDFKITKENKTFNTCSLCVIPTLEQMKLLPCLEIEEGDFQLCISADKHCKDLVDEYSNYGQFIQKLEFIDYGDDIDDEFYDVFPNIKHIEYYRAHIFNEMSEDVYRFKNLKVLEIYGSLRIDFCRLTHVEEFILHGHITLSEITHKAKVTFISNIIERWMLLPFPEYLEVVFKTSSDRISVMSDITIDEAMDIVGNKESQNTFTTYPGYPLVESKKYNIYGSEERVYVSPKEITTIYSVSAYEPNLPVNFGFETLVLTGSVYDTEFKTNIKNLLTYGKIIVFKLCLDIDHENFRVPNIVGELNFKTKFTNKNMVSFELRSLSLGNMYLCNGDFQFDKLEYFVIENVLIYLEENCDIRSNIPMKFINCAFKYKNIEKKFNGELTELSTKQIFG